MGKPAIGNFALATDKIKHKGGVDYTCLSNNELTPAYLQAYAQKKMTERGGVKEGSILLVIDECQLLFNSRDWNAKGRNDWLAFYTLHRHLGYDIVLVAQFDRMIDRQIRSLIEYEYIHRKVSNYGWKGKIFSLLAFGNLFVCVKVWYPMKERVGSEFFRMKKKYYGLYDTFVMFPKLDACAQDGGPKGGPAEVRTPESATSPT